MKKLLIIILFIPFLGVAQNVEFDENDANILRQIIVSMNGGGALTAKQLKQLEIANDVISSKGKVPVNRFDDDVMLKFAEMYAYKYSTYKQAEADAAKFIFIMKRLYKNDPKLFEKLETQRKISFGLTDLNKIKNEVIKD